MTAFKQALQVLKENPQMLESIEENIQMQQMKNPIYKEEIINGYKLQKNYKKNFNPHLTPLKPPFNTPPKLTQIFKFKLF